VPTFNTHRMVSEYAKKYYVPAMQRFASLEANELALARSSAEWKQGVSARFARAKFSEVEILGSGDIGFGERLRVRATLELGQALPEEIAVEAYFGPTGGAFDVPEGRVAPLALMRTEGQRAIFEGEITPETSGTHAFAVRAYPWHPNVPKHAVGPMLWS
jgi:glycogen phosphorylase